MLFEMEYDGQVVTGKGRRSFASTFRTAGITETCQSDNSPIPEDFYKVFIGNQGLAQDDGRGFCPIKPAWGIQNIPRRRGVGSCENYWANCGNSRARMEPAGLAAKIKCTPI